ncbi:hypothetical protein EDWATA_01912 [Edwardsiella tarda ATCC 23685]|uniref:Uncharacterized protein n=1 Tax=Edwardsiella tarda ATCC 23685 TaxID=500638 RepID=D4F584_EDWTA|nr:hypothetical protein EDWATA_01912 [Edwardsiella tarda ATCC 23685]
MPRNSESRAISYVLKAIKLLYPSVMWVQSFADERYRWFGIVYQASNFDYIGYHYLIFWELDGEWYHEIARNAISLGGKHGEYLRANIGRATAHRFK